VTAHEASGLVANLAREVSATRRERDGWRRLALSSFDYLSAGYRAGAMTDPNSVVYRAALASMKRDIDDQLAADCRSEAA
jgi:hypothetical protein